MAKVEGLSELLKNLDSFKNECANVIVKAVFHGCTLIMNEAKQNHPYIDRTGDLTRSIQALPPEVNEDKIIGETEASKEYAASVELGWRREENPQSLRRNSSRPYPYLFPALEKLSPAINEEIMALIRQIRWVNK